MTAHRGHLVLDLLAGGREIVGPLVDIAATTGALPGGGLMVGQDCSDGLGQGRLLSHHQHSPHPDVCK